MQPELVKKPWGITDVEKYTGISTDNQKYGEVWLASAHITELKEGQDGAQSNKICNSDLNLNQLISKFPKLLGETEVDSRPKGKTECWYFREVIGEVKIVTGLKSHITKERFKQMIEEGYFDNNPNFEDLENNLIETVIVQKGDAYLLEPGTVHTIYPTDKDSFAIIDEVQQGFGNNNLPTISKILMVNDLLSLQVHPSDEQVRNTTDTTLKQQFLAEPTIRIYDFGRGRKSMLAQSADFISFNKKTCFKITPIRSKINNYILTNLFKTGYFSKDIIEFDQDIHLSHKNNYYIYCVIEGHFAIHDQLFNKGDIFLVGAGEKVDISCDNKAILIRDYMEKIT